MKKYKIRKRKKFVNPYIIFAIFAISILFVSTGYAIFSDSLNIVGKANILASGGSDVEYGNSTYNYKLYSIWPNSFGGMTYQTIISFTNLDEDMDSWEIKFDLPDGFLIDKSDLWQASSRTLSGNTVTLKDAGWNGYIANGSTFDFNFILAFDREVDFNFTNFIVNGKSVNWPIVNQN